MKPKNHSRKTSRFSTLTVILIGGLAVGDLRAADGTWIKLDGNSAWATAANWSPTSMASPGATSGTSNSDIASFTGALSATRIVNIDPYRNIGGLTFGANNTNSGYAINGGTTGNLILSSGGVIELDATATSGSHFSTVNVTVTLAGNAAFSNNATGTNRRLKFQAVNGSATVGNVSNLTIGGSNTSSLNEMVSPIGDGANGGMLALTMSGAGTWTLTSSSINTYTGATTVSAGRLLINGSTASGSAVTVGGATATGSPTLGGVGTIAGATTIAAAGSGVVGTHAPGVPGVTNGVGTQTFSNTLTYGSGSIFEWNLQAASPTDPGVVSNTGTGTYDKVVASGSSGSVTGGSAIFKIVLGGNAFADAFWNTNKSWTDVFTGSGAPSDLDLVFSTFGGSGVSSNGTVTDRGQFTFNGSSTLTWTAVPEPTSALAGLLLSAGLLRRRRS